ncbi:MAG: ComEA family DNA-binding protein [Candidatus Levybacteria bacterium]|nr:ComEA family DNA-binding protein [Candidatus Levybacteria bacterium]
MDFHSLVEKYGSLIKQHWLPLVLGFLGLIFFVYGLISFFGGSAVGEKDIVFEKSNENSAADLKQEIIVDVEGAVVKQGVYKLSANARIQDALVAAGGLSAQADRQWAAKSLNLAVKLTDGAKIYVPAVGEGIKSTTGITSITGGGQTGDISTLININTASEQELDSLPGVGAVTAQKITNNRPYGSIDELLTKKIVGSKVFEQIKGKISVY